MQILIVLTSHDQLGSTGKKTGFWLEEFAAPYYELKDAGAAITLASPKGGQPPLDPKSDLPENLTELTKRFRSDDDAQANGCDAPQMLIRNRSGTIIDTFHIGLFCLRVRAWTR